MLTRMRLTIRTFDNEEIRFAPLTVLIGPNSAGKSTVLYSLVLLSQSLMQKKQTPLAVNGPWVDMGEFDNLAPKGYVHFLLEWVNITEQQGIEFVVQKQGQSLQVPRGSFWYYQGGKKYSLPSRVRPWYFSFIPDVTETDASLSEELQVLRWVNVGLRRVLSQLHYLGAYRRPVRTKPESCLLPVDSVGPDARDLISFLAFHQDVVQQINQFLGNYNIGPIEVVCQKNGGDIYHRYSDAVKVRLADGGSGCFNLIPTLAELFGAPGESLVLLEQPETCLHPQLSLCVADAMISAIQQGKNILVETHSKEIILRLRRRIAEGILDPNLMVVYWVYRVGTKSSLTRVEFNEMGRPTPGWPIDFWEEDYCESSRLIKAVIQRIRESEEQPTWESHE